MNYMMEEENKFDDHEYAAHMQGIEICAICRNVITHAEQQAENMIMLLSTDCYHQMHKTCFNEYAKKLMTTPLPK